MDRKEFILNVLQKGRLDINGFFLTAFCFRIFPMKR